MPVDGIAVTVVNEVAQVEGEIDMATASAFDAALEALPGTLRLDLSAVTFLDSSGVSVLVRHYQQRCQDGSGFTIISLSPIVRRVLEVCGLLELLTGRREAPMRLAASSATEDSSRLDLAG